MIASDAVASNTSLSVICPTALCTTLIAISCVESFCKESLKASTDPSTSPLMMMLSSLKLPSANLRPISSSVICFLVRIPCSRMIWALLPATSLASDSSWYTLNFSPACGAPLRPRISTGDEGGMASTRLFLSFIMALTLP